MTATLLVEIGVEELPTAAMRPLADALAAGLDRALTAAGLTHGEVTRFATPRRLAVAIADTATRSDGETLEKQGPTIDIAFDDHGSPTAAGRGFARSVGVDISELDRESTNKGQRLVYRGNRPGRPLSEILQDALDQVLRGLPVAKRMRWGDGDAAFVRPVHWLLALHGRDVVDVDVFAQIANRQTFGHRFHHPAAIELATADEYAAQLADPGYVIADPDKRLTRVRDEVIKAANTVGGRALLSDELLEEVVALVEWPVGIAGRFDARFLELPREVLIATLEGHQRYFPVQEETGALMAGFITLANLESRDVAQVIAGNERVVRPRLADALFFWEADRAKGLAAYIDGLSRVSFQQALGSLADKSARVHAIADRLADATGANRRDVARAATLSKTDLLTDMVGEFPELQGVMGRYYALAAGEASTVANAIAEQYQPMGSGSAIAASALGQTMALADRLDTLAGIFAINERPSGDKDPFALRRAALGVLRTLIEGGIGLDLRQALADAIAAQPLRADDDVLDALWMFHVERLRSYYAEQSIAGSHFDAVNALGIVDMLDFDRRIQAVGYFVGLPEAATIYGIHKRIRNILRRNKAELTATRSDTAQLIDPAEIQLAETLENQQNQVDNALAEGRYDVALAALAPFAEPLDRFFDQVMVMSENKTLRHNRLALLSEIDVLCRAVADISWLSVE